ncbi:fumarylacetoacetate hydrolase family protein [Clostridiaceae bacterium M8S5]|nr:fumarylacetoacetate hydrolase family protein [Clostridiaceae bacterium M8S5]
MYLLTYIYDDKYNLGTLTKEKDKVIPIDVIYRELKMSPPKDMLDLIKTSNSTIIKKISNISGIMYNQAIDIATVKITAPIRYPHSDIICLGKNYADHAKEVMGMTSDNLGLPKYPIYFSKRANPAIGDNDIIKYHTDSMDYEVELAIIIGKDGININKEDVSDYIFGYTIANDISARRLQKKHIQWYKAKSLDTFCPMGPYIVHKSSLPSKINLDIQCYINGELRQNSNTSNLIFDIPYIVSDLSKNMKLYSGDIILTGTPAGVGLGYKPPKFLKRGDKIESFIEGIGTLVNYVSK